MCRRESKNLQKVESGLIIFSFNLFRVYNIWFRIEFEQHITTFYYQFQKIPEIQYQFLLLNI